MPDQRLEFEADSRTLPPGCDLDTPLLSLVWQATQRWSTEIKQLQHREQAAREQEHIAWIALADECFHLRRVSAALLSVDEAAGRSRNGAELANMVRRIEQTLQLHGVTVVAPVGSPYTPELSEILENVGQVAQHDITEPVVQEVLTPIISSHEEVIRFGRAIIAVPEQR